MTGTIVESSLTRPASPAVIGAAIAAAEDRIEQIALGNIHSSPTNPRKTFDGIEDLAASIAEQGLLQPIVVRPMKKDGDFEILAGERRFRALKHLKRATAPCKVVVANDGQARALQIVENLQREDIKPMEEAEAFKALQDLDPKTWTNQAIAKAIGRTDRFVQQRLAMATNLVGPARDMLAKGEIKVETARILASAPASTQVELIDKGARHGWQELSDMSPEEVRAEINDRAVPLGKAAFDVSLYDGPWFEDGKQKRFADAEKFDVLQLEAAKALLKKLRLVWPDARIVKAGSVRDWAWADNKANLQYGPPRKSTKAERPWKIAEEKVTAIVWIAEDKGLHHAEGVTKVDNVSSTTTTHSAAPKIKPETPEHEKARRKFSADLRAAAAQKPGLLKCLTLMALLAAENDVADDDVEAEIRKGIDPALKTFAQRYAMWGDDKAKALKAMLALKPTAIDRAIALMAVSHVNWPDYPRQMPADIKAIAAELGIKFVEPKPEPEKKPDTGPGDKEAKLAKAKPKAAAKKKAAAARKKHR